ncbi:rod shape-determining protein MreD [bacterium]
MFRNVFGFIFILITILVMQIQVVFYYNIKLFFPNLFLLLVIFYSLWLGSSTAQLIAFFLGLIFDVFTFNVFGTNMLLFPLIAYLVNYLSQRFDKKTVTSQLVITLIVSIVYVIGYYAIQGLFSYKKSFSTNAVFFLQPLFITLLMPIAFYFYRFVLDKIFRTNIENVAK